MTLPTSKSKKPQRLRTMNMDARIAIIETEIKNIGISLDELKASVKGTVTAKDFESFKVEIVRAKNDAHDDFEKRIRSLEQNYWRMAGGLAALTVIIDLIARFIIK